MSLNSRYRAKHIPVLSLTARSIVRRLAPVPPAIEERSSRGFDASLWSIASSSKAGSYGIIYKNVK